MESGIRNSDITTDLNLWNRQTKLGKVFDSSTEFKLPSGAYRCPDASWVKLERWQALTKEEQKRFPPICPDFVIELRSESDVLEKLRLKMREYQNNGASLGWLIDPQTPLVEIYRSQQDVEVLNFSFDNPPQLLGEDVLPGSTWFYFRFDYYFKSLENKSLLTQRLYKCLKMIFYSFYCDRIPLEIRHLLEGNNYPF